MDSHKSPWDTPPMKDLVITPRDKLLDLIKETTDVPVDREVVLRLHQFSKKFISDILTRASHLTEHKNNKVITDKDIFFVVEKEFDYLFGESDLFYYKNLPDDEHVEKMAELSKHNK